MTSEDKLTHSHEHIRHKFILSFDKYCTLRVMQGCCIVCVGTAASSTLIGSLQSTRRLIGQHAALQHCRLTVTGRDCDSVTLSSTDCEVLIIYSFLGQTSARDVNL